MRGVPFFWSLHLFPVLIFNMVILLFVFYQIDKRSYRKDIENGRKPDIRKPGTQFRLDGLHNIIFLVMIVGAVILSGVLPGMSAFQDAAGNVRGIHLFGEVTLTFPALIEIVIILETMKIKKIIICPFLFLHEFILITGRTISHWLLPYGSF